MGNLQVRFLEGWAPANGARPLDSNGAVGFTGITSAYPVRDSGVFPRVANDLLRTNAHPTSHFRTLLFEFGQFQPGVDLQFPPNFMHVKDFSPRLLGTRPA